MAPRLVLAIGCALALSLPAPRPAGAAGSVASEGDSILRADLARATFGVTGAGIRVGIISTGIQGLDVAKASGDLPAATCGPQSGGTTAIDANLCRGFVVAVDTDPEGTAMMEIIHDLAPGAELLFCAADTSLGMASCIDFLAARANVIVDDIGFFAEPYFEDGVVATAAARAVASGVAYASAAGNEALIHYQGMYVDSGDERRSHQISAGNTSFRVTGSSARMFLQWSNKFGMSADNYDLCLASETPSECASFNRLQDGDDDPLESTTLACSAGCDLQVRLVSGSPQLLELFALDGTLATQDRVTADSVFGHPAVSGVVAVSAIAAGDPGNDSVEAASNRGPATIVFPTLETRQKPDVAAIDGVSVSGAGGFPKTFFGTSAAAPHAAAIAALVLEANRSLTPAQVQTLLRQTAVPLGSPVPNFDSGFGRIDAFAAVQAARAVPSVSIATNQTSYRAGDRMVVTVTTAPNSSAERWYLAVALVTPINTPDSPFFLFRFSPVIELITLQAALGRSSFGDIAARPIQTVGSESVTILDLALPLGLPVGSYQWAAALFSEDLRRTSSVATAPWSFE